MKGSQILVVDDELANQFLLDGLLGAQGYQPIIASGGAECFEILKSEKPDLILLDIMMPKMTGIEVLDILMKSEEWKHIPVIMVSAKTASSDIQEALNKGAIDYIKKPFDEMELLARVKVGIRLKENEDNLRDMIRLRNDFVKIISHDLRSPFTAIYGFAEILAKADNLTDDQKDSLGYIIQSVEYSDDYFNKLLSWTMLDHGDLRLNRCEIQIKAVLDSAIRIFQHKADTKHISIENLVMPSFNLNADETFFRQVVANLLNNAIKFTKENGKIKVSTSAESESIFLIISDNGIGMPDLMTPETLFGDSILASRKGTKGEKGTGIGLSICKKILDAHGFELSFKRNSEGGTDFMIIVPQYST